MKRILAVLLLGIAVSAPVAAEDQINRMAPAEAATLNFDELQWFPDPSLPAGSELSLITGNPGAAEVFMVYVKLPPNTVIAPHTHPFAEVVTILKGSVGNGHGEKVDKTNGKMLNAGSTFILPAGHAHYMWNDEEVIALLTATGPWNINYVNQADDPRNQ